MKSLDIIRAWKDPKFRLSLNEAERQMLPEHPAGMIELSETDQIAVAGGRLSEFASLQQYLDENTPREGSYVNAMDALDAHRPSSGRMGSGAPLWPDPDWDDDGQPRWWDDGEPRDGRSPGALSG